MFSPIFPHAQTPDNQNKTNYSHEHVHPSTEAWLIELSQEKSPSIFLFIQNVINFLLQSQLIICSTSSTFTRTGLIKHLVVPTIHKARHVRFSVQLLVQRNLLWLWRGSILKRFLGLFLGKFDTMQSFRVGTEDQIRVLAVRVGVMALTALSIEDVLFLFHFNSNP